jgi:hypothetical protein
LRSLRSCSFHCWFGPRRRRGRRRQKLAAVAWQ